MVCNDVNALRTTEYPQDMLRKLKPNKAIYAYLHFSQSFKDLAFVRKYFGVNRVQMFNALLNGRMIRLKTPRSPTLLLDLTEDDVEPMAFAWLVWAAAHFTFLPWSFLDMAFAHVPRIDVDEFNKRKEMHVFDERCQTLLYARNDCIAAYAVLTGRKVDRDVPREQLCKLLDTATTTYPDAQWTERLSAHL